MTAAEHLEVTAGKFDAANGIFAAWLAGEGDWFATDQSRWAFGVRLERVLWHLSAAGVRLP